MRDPVLTRQSFWEMLSLLRGEATKQAEAWEKIRDGQHYTEDNTMGWTSVRDSLREAENEFYRAFFVEDKV
jgi:hypothetical protein